MKFKGCSLYSTCMFSDRYCKHVFSELRCYLAGKVFLLKLRRFRIKRKIYMLVKRISK